VPIESSVERSIVVRSGQGDYPVVFCSGPGRLEDLLKTENVFVVVDRLVASLWPDLFADCDREAMLPVEATEAEKTLAGVERVCRFLQGRAASKTSHLVIIGGGIVQDIGTFAAHIYYRGIPFTYVPTTLLSMADSCIGAKSAVNLGSFKNQLGFFQSPKTVLLWTDWLGTLGLEDVRSGFGEIVKLAITEGRESFGRLEDRLDREQFAVQGLEEIIFAALETKRRVIEEDEYEAGLRKILNYGHTFGHAMESLTYHEVPHGLAVAWGMDMANYIAVSRGLLSGPAWTSMHRVLSKYFTFKVGTKYDAASLLAAMRRDKKAAGGGVTLVLLEDFGRLQLVPTKIDSSLEAVMAEYLARYDIFGTPEKIA